MAVTGTRQPAPAGLTGLIGGVARDPRRPVLVCHRADGARTELSAGSLANWVAKVAGLLRDELGLGPGDLAIVRAVTGWQLAPVLLSCWWAGITVTDTADAAGAAVAFVDPGCDADADEVFVLSGDPLGAPATGFAAHQRDFTTAVLPQSDRWTAAANSGDGWAAARRGAAPVTAGDLATAAAAAAGDLARAAAVAAADVAGRPTAPGRPVLLSTREWTVPDGVAATLLAALAADGALVQCPAGLSAAALAAIAVSERATASVGADVPGLPSVAG